MKLDNNFHQGKPPLLEEGPLKYERMDEDLYTKRVKRGSNWNQCLYFMKIIIYVELALLIGWLGCIVLANYYADHGYYGGYRTKDIPESTPDNYGQDSSISSDVMPLVDNAWKSEERWKTFTEKSEAAMSHRDTRSAEVKDAEEEMCHRKANATGMVLERLANKVVSGDASNPNITERRHNLIKVVWKLCVAVMTAETISQMDGMFLRPQSPLFALSRKMRNSTDEYRRVLVAEGVEPTQEMLNELRNTIESMASLYASCIDNLTVPQEQRETLRAMKVIIEQEKCLRSNRVMRENMQSLTTEIVNGEFSDETDLNLRQEFKRMVGSYAEEMTVAQLTNAEDLLKIGPLNVTDEQWQAKLIELKTELAKVPEDSAIRQQIQDSGPPTQKQTNEFRDIVEYYVRQYLQCNERQMLNIIVALRELDWTDDRRKRSIDNYGQGSSISADVMPLVDNAWKSEERWETFTEKSEAAMSHRDTRSAEVTDPETETCDRKINATGMDLERLTNQVVIGDTTDSTITESRHNFIKVAWNLCVSVMAPETLKQTDSMFLETQTPLFALFKNMRNSTEEYRRVLVAEGVEPTQEMLNEICNTVESMASLYANCTDNLRAPQEQWKTVRAITVITEHEKCLRSHRVMRENMRSLITEILKGESSDETVFGLHQKFNRMIESYAEEMTVLQLKNAEDLLKIGPLNVTDEQWQAKLIELKTELAKVPEDSAIRQRIQDSGPPTKKQTNEFRDIVEYYVRQYLQCNERQMLNIIVALRELDWTDDRRKRSIDSNVEQKNVGASEIHQEAGWKLFGKRSIGYPSRKSDNSINVLNKISLDSGHTVSLRRLNLGADGNKLWSHEMSQENFFNKMETLSSHIDHLHEHYSKFNELNDDYISKEFPDESPLNDEY